MAQLRAKGWQAQHLLFIVGVSGFRAKNMITSWCVAMNLIAAPSLKVGLLFQKKKRFAYTKFQNRIPALQHGKCPGLNHYITHTDSPLLQRPENIGLVTGLQGAPPPPCLRQTPVLDPVIRDHDASKLKRRIRNNRQ